MENKRDRGFDSKQEVNLKDFFRKVFKHKFLFLASIIAFVALAVAYIFITTPKYEVGTSLLIDSSGSNRVLGESQYVEGGVSLIEMEKNLYNEVGIIKSFSLIKQTVEDLNLDVSYYLEGWAKKKEYYGYFPFEVELDKRLPQLYATPFEVKIISETEYRLSVEASNFTISNPKTGSSHEVEREFNFSGIFKFGETVKNDYFNFVLQKPDYKVNVADFEGTLSFEVYDLEALASAYAGNLTVNNIDIQASIFNITCTGPVVDKEVKFLEKLTENYIKNQLVSRNEIALSKEEFIKNQLKDISDSLVKVESKLEQFKKGDNALDLSKTAINALDKTTNLQVRRAKIGMDINLYETLISTIEDNRNNEEFVMPTTVGMEDPIINRNIVDLKDLYAKRSKKRFFITSNNEEMVILNREIAQSTNVLLSNLRGALKSANFSLESVNAELSNVGGLIGDLPTQQNALLTIQRQSTLYENLFNYMSQELAKTGIARGESTSDARVLDTARLVGDGPVFPQKKLIMVLAITLGLLLPLAWIVIFSPKNIIENITQIKESTNIPVLSSIVAHESKKSELSIWKLKESFRDLSAKLNLLNSEGTSVLGITSILPGEGKTYTSINLGITLAEAGKKVLIVDADLRKPGLVKGIQKVNKNDLTAFLKGNITEIDSIIHEHDEVSSLHFIPTSVVKGNVHKLLSGSKLEDLIESLKSRYDYIILDTPAVGLVSDFLTLYNLMDINLFVVRRGIAKLQFLDDLEEIASQDKNKQSFIVYNGALKEQHKYGYGEKYGLNQEEQVVNESLSVQA